MKLYNKRKIFWVDEDLAKQLKKYCIKVKKKEADIIRQAIRKFLEEINDSRK